MVKLLCENCLATRRQIETNVSDFNLNRLCEVIRFFLQCKVRVLNRLLCARSSYRIAEDLITLMILVDINVVMISTCLLFRDCIVSLGDRRSQSPHLFT